MKATADSGVKVSAGATHKKGDGTLVWSSYTREGLFSGLLSDWDAWRVSYCARHRDDILPEGLREGAASPSLLLKSYFLKRKDKHIRNSMR